MQVCWQSLNKHDESISAKRAEENVKVLVLELVELWTKGSFYFKTVLMRQAFVTEELGGNSLDARPLGPDSAIYHMNDPLASLRPFSASVYSSVKWESLSLR